MIRRLRCALPALVTLGLLGLGAGACSDGAATNDAALRAALASSAGKVGAEALGPVVIPLRAAAPHRATITATITLGLPGGDRTLTIVRVIDRGREGRYRISEVRTMKEPGGDAIVDSRDGVFDGQRFAQRRGTGPYIERDVLRGGHLRYLREAYDLGDGLLSGFQPYLVQKEDPSADEAIAGLPVRWAALSLDARVHPRAMGEPELNALRDHETNWVAWLSATHEPKLVKGAIARTRDTGEVVAGTIELSGEAQVSGIRAPFTLELEQKVAALSEGEAFALPAEVLPASRPRPWKMIEDVLGDALLPPYAPPKLPSLPLAAAPEEGDDEAPAPSGQSAIPAVSPK